MVDPRSHAKGGEERGKQSREADMMTENAVPFQGQFLLEWNRGGISSLKLKDDVYDTEYITPGETLGEVLVGYRVGGGEWRSATNFSSGDIRRLKRLEAGRGRSCTAATASCYTDYAGWGW